MTLESDQKNLGPIHFLVFNDYFKKFFGYVFLCVYLEGVYEYEFNACRLEEDISSPGNWNTETQDVGAETQTWVLCKKQYISSPESCHFNPLAMMISSSPSHHLLPSVTTLTTLSWASSEAQSSEISLTLDSSSKAGAPGHSHLLSANYRFEGSSLP